MIGSTPNVQYVGDTILAELALVKQPEFLTNVGKVGWAPFDLDDEELITYATVQPCFFLWLEDEKESEFGLGGSKDWLDVTYRVVGAATGAWDIQALVGNMAVDLRRVVRQNSNRLFPGETGGTDYCKGSRLPELKYRFGKMAASMGYGGFNALVTCTIAFPHATG